MALGDIAKKLGYPPTLVYAVKARESGGGRARNKKSGRGPGRPPKAKATSAPTQIDGLAGILRAVQGAERERVRMRAALEKIQAVLRDVMA